MRFFAAALFFPLFALGQAEWNFAHPDATLVGSLRPTALLDSPLLASGWTGAAPNDPQLAGMMAMAKGMLSGIREIRFSLLDSGTPEPDVLAVIDGRFDPAILGMLGPAGATFRRLDVDKILFGKGASLEKAAARATQTTPVLQPRALAGTAALAGYDIWVSGGIPNIPNGSLKLPDGLKADVRGVALGMSLRGNVEIELALDAASPAAAEALLKAARTEEAAQPVQFRGLLQSFADRNTARFRMNIPQALVMDAMRVRTTPAPVAGVAAIAAEPKPLPAAAKPRRIVIQGLDEGPREIPVQ